MPLIEKAFAKYYGSYSELQHGHVHHALRDLTGCEAEEIHLCKVRRTRVGVERGVGRYRLAQARRPHLSGSPVWPEGGPQWHMGHTHLLIPVPSLAPLWTHTLTLTP